MTASEQYRLDRLLKSRTDANTLKYLLSEVDKSKKSESPQTSNAGIDLPECPHVDYDPRIGDFCNKDLKSPLSLPQIEKRALSNMACDVCSEIRNQDTQLRKVKQFRRQNEANALPRLQLYKQQRKAEEVLQRKYAKPNQKESKNEEEIDLLKSSEPQIKEEVPVQVPPGNETPQIEETEISQSEPEPSHSVEHPCPLSKQIPCKKCKDFIDCPTYLKIMENRRNRADSNLRYEP